jgi:hypothetical protein
MSSVELHFCPKWLAICRNRDKNSNNLAPKITKEKAQLVGIKN